MIIKVRAIQNSEENYIIGRVGSTIRLRIKSSLTDKGANEELITFLSEFFRVQYDSVKIIRGKRGKEKTVEITGKSEDMLKNMLDAIP